MHITPIIIDVGIIAVQTDSIAEISLGRMDIRNTLALSTVKLIHLSLTNSTLPVSQRTLFIQREIIGEIADGCLEITENTVSDGPAHQQTLLLLDILSHTQLSRQLINQREDHQRAVLIQLLLGTYDINLIGRSLRLSSILLAGSTATLLSLSQVHIELFHFLVKRLNTVQILHIREVRELIHRQIGSLHLPVLDASTILALVIVLILRFILNNDRSKLIRIYLRTLAHLLPGLRAPSRLNTQMLVHLRLEDTEFIHLGLCCHT